MAFAAALRVGVPLAAVPNKVASAPAARHCAAATAPCPRPHPRYAAALAARSGCSLRGTGTAVVLRAATRGGASAARRCLLVVAEADDGSAPPTSKKEALSQASTAVNALVNRVVKKPPAKVKKGKKARDTVGFTDEQKSGKRGQVLVPLLNNSARELADLTANILSNVSANTVVYFGDKSAVDLFQGGAAAEARALDEVGSMELTPSETQLVLLVGPTLEQFDKLKIVAERTSCACILVNAEWDPDGLAPGSFQKSFLESFEVVYWHLPLDIQGLMSKSSGAVFKFVEAGAPASTQWRIFWNGEVVSKQTKRPTPIQLEQVLYNKAAEDSKLVQAAAKIGSAKDALTSGFGLFGGKNKK